MPHDELPAFEKISKRTHHHISLPTVTKFPTCSGKMSFTKARSRRVIRALTEKHGVQKELRAYRCPKNSQH
jgi:ribosomal protein L32